MRKFLTTVFIFFMFGAVLQILSCNNDNPLDTETDPREKFLGTWSVEESCASLNYEVNITPDEFSSTRVHLENFADAPAGSPQAYGLVNEIQINIPEQTIGDDWLINGIGTLQQSGKIVWAYYIEVGAVGSKCDAVFEQ